MTETLGIIHGIIRVKYNDQFVDLPGTMLCKVMVKRLSRRKVYSFIDDAIGY